MKLLFPLLFCWALAVRSQQTSLPFSFTVSERTENLPTYVSPHLPNLYNATPTFKVGWGIDYPIGNVIIDNETWVIFNSGNQYGTHVKVARFKGADFEHTIQQADGSIDVEKDVSTHFLGGMWYDNSAGKLYAPIHCEYKRDITPPAGWSRKRTRLATSTDKGLSWKMEGDILTDCMPGDDDWLAFSGSFFQAGPADCDLFADFAGGYFYIFSCNSYAPKNGPMNNYLWFNEAARCAISDKMAPGKWHKFRNGTWTEPGLGGKSSKVSMDSYGIYGRVIYSTFLKTYVRIGPCLGVADKRYTDTGFADHSIYISTCNDLAKQEWSPRLKLFDKPDNDKLGITLTDGNLKDPFICDSTLCIYNYWLYNIPSRAMDVTFAAGNTATAGFPRYGSYAYEPLPESGDPIVSRKTRIVGCTHPDITYTGSAWTIRNDPKYYGTEIQVSDAPGSGIQFSFKGASIYWRAVADSDGGKVDVYLDDKLEETVDCYFKEPLPFQFAFVKNGLDAKQTHTIRIVIRADGNSLSCGTTIRHMAFEHGAESYNASAGFSSVMGKNNWLYQQGDGEKYGNLDFHLADTIHAGGSKTGKEKLIYPNYWGTKEIGLVGNIFQVPGNMDAVRTFIAPHAGEIRIEGKIEIEKGANAAFTVKIMTNDNTELLAKRVTFAQPVTHDLVIPVAKDDAVYFIVKRNDGKQEEKVMWNPTITFSDP
jgi:hypothetical protein